MNRKSNATTSPIRLAFNVLLGLVLLLGGLLVYNVVLQLDAIEAKGRVVKWEGDYAFIKFASEAGDSIFVKSHLPYIKDQTALRNYDVVPIRYSPISPTRFEIEGVIGDSLAGVIFLFVFFLVGLVFASINLKREKSLPG